MSTSSIDPTNNFQFYLSLAKPLILHLADANDRIVAAAWVQKLRDPNVGSEQLRTDYLKLLLFVLQRSRIIGPFKENPNDYDKLEEFPANYKLHDVAKELLEAEEAERRQRILRGLAGPSGDYPPFTIEYSSNLREYSAAQEIPNFGVQAFYALSKEPLHKWENITTTIFPKGIQIPEESLIEIKSTRAVEVEEADINVLSETAKSRLKSLSKSGASIGVSREDAEAVGDGPKPSIKKGPKITVEIGPTDADAERVSPKWGSNLMNVEESQIETETSVCPCPDDDLDEFERFEREFVMAPADIAEQDVATSAAASQEVVSEVESDLLEKEGGLLWPYSEELDEFERLERELQIPTSGPSVITPIPGASEAVQKLIAAANTQFAELPSSTPVERATAVKKKPSKPTAKKGEKLAKKVEKPPKKEDKPTKPAGKVPSKKGIPKKGMQPEKKPSRPRQRRAKASKTTAKFRQVEEFDSEHVPAYQARRTSPETQFAGVAAVSVADAYGPTAPTRELDMAAEYAELYPDRLPTDPRTPPLFSKYRHIRESIQGQQVYPQDQFPHVGPVQWTPAPEYLEDAEGPSPYLDYRELSEFERSQAEMLFPDIEVDATGGLDEEKPEFEGLDTSFEEAAVAVTKEKTVHEIVQSSVQQQEISPAAAGIPITTPKLTPSPRAFAFLDTSPPDIFSKTPPILSPEKDMPFDEYELPVPIKTPKTPFQPPITSPVAAQPPLTTIMPPRISPGGPPPSRISPDRLPSPYRQPSPKISPDRLPSPYRQPFPKISSPTPPSPHTPPIPYTPPTPVTPQPPWSPRMTPPKTPKPTAAPETPPELVEAYLPMVPGDMITYEIPPEEEYGFDQPPSFPSPKFDDEFTGSPEDVGAYSPPLREILESHEISPHFKDPTRPKMTPYVIRGRRRIPLHKERRYVDIPSPIKEAVTPHRPETVLPSATPQRPKTVVPSVTPYRPKTVAPVKPRKLTDVEKFFINEFSDATQREMVAKALSTAADVESDIPYMQPEIPELPPLDVSTAEGYNIFAVSPPQGTDYELPDEVTIHRAEEQYRLLADESSPPSRRISPTIPSQPEVRRIYEEEDIDEFELMEAEIRRQEHEEQEMLRRMGTGKTPPSVPRPSPRTPRTPKTRLPMGMYTPPSGELPAIRTPRTPPIPWVPTWGEFVAKETDLGIPTAFQESPPPAFYEDLEQIDQAPVPVEPSPPSYEKAALTTQRVITRPLPRRVLDYEGFTPPSYRSAGYFPSTRPERTRPLPRRVLDYEGFTPPSYERGLDLPPPRRVIRGPIPRKVLDFAEIAPMSPTETTPRSIRATIPEAKRQIVRRPRRLDFDQPSPQEVPAQAIPMFHGGRVIPDLPVTPYPEDLMGISQPTEYRPSPGLMDTLVPTLLPAPIEPQYRPGQYQTPPHLRPILPHISDQPRDFAPLPSYAQQALGVASQRITPFGTPQRVSPTGMRTPTTDVEYPSPPFSPTTAPIFSPTQQQRLAQQAAVLAATAQQQYDMLDDDEIDEFEQLEKQFAESPRPIRPQAAPPSAVQKVIEDQYAALCDLDRTPSPPGLKLPTPPDLPALGEEYAPLAVFDSPPEPATPRKWYKAKENLFVEDIPEDLLPITPTATPPRVSPRAPIIPGGKFHPPVFATQPTSPVGDYAEAVPTALTYLYSPMDNEDEVVITKSPFTPITKGDLAKRRTRTIKRKRLYFSPEPEPQIEETDTSAAAAPVAAVTPVAATTPVTVKDFYPKVSALPLEQLEHDLRHVQLSPTSVPVPAAQYQPGSFVSSPPHSPIISSPPESYTPVTGEVFVYESPTTPRTPPRPPSPSEMPFTIPEVSEGYGPLQQIEEPGFTTPSPPRRQMPPSPPGTFEYMSPERLASPERLPSPRRLVSPGRLPSPGRQLSPPFSSPDISPDFSIRIAEHERRLPSQKHKREKIAFRRKMVPGLEDVEETDEPAFSPGYVPLGALVSITPPNRLQRLQAELLDTASRQYAMLMDDSPEQAPQYPSEIAAGAASMVTDVDVDSPDVYEHTIMDAFTPAAERVKLQQPLMDPYAWVSESPPRETYSIVPTDTSSPALTAQTPPREYEEGTTVIEEEEIEEFETYDSYDQIIPDMDDSDYLDATQPGPLEQTPPFDYGPETVPSPYLSYTPDQLLFDAEPPAYDYGPEQVPSPVISYTPSPPFRDLVTRHEYTQDYFTSAYQPSRPPIDFRRLPVVREARDEPIDEYRRIPPGIPSQEIIEEETEEFEEIIEEEATSPCSSDGICGQSPEGNDELSRSLRRQYTTDEMEQFAFLDQ